jgi:hypothetical protein
MDNCGGLKEGLFPERPHQAKNGMACVNQTPPRFPTGAHDYK